MQGLVLSSSYNLPFHYFLSQEQTHDYSISIYEDDNLRHVSADPEGGKGDICRPKKR